MSFKIATMASILKPGKAGPVPCIEGWGDKPGRDVIDQVASLTKRMKPGDIITTDPRRPVRHHRIFKALSKTVQGSRFGHNAMYVGDGNVVDVRDNGVISRHLLDLARCNQFMVHRPKVPEADRMRAAKWMKDNIGNRALNVTVGNLVVHGAKPTVLSSKHEGKRQELDRAICSAVIANAYSKVPFNANRRIADTRPSDILRSKHVKRIGVVN
jgi:hypothetical protein